jgi:short-subunit dehydrogenase
MNRGLRNELSFLTGLSALGLYFLGKPKLAATLGAGAITARIFPSVAPFSYRNRSVVITGGSRGLGLAMAKRLVHEGARITLLARDGAELERAKGFLEKDKSVKNLGSAISIVCDVSDPEDLRAAFNRVEAEYGGIDVLINNAGSVSAGPFEATNERDFEAQMNLHFFAILRATRLILPYFKKTGGGRIVNISSLGGKMSVPHMSPYCASKFALSGFSQGISAELRRDGIYVTTVYPGLMRTGSPIQAVFKSDQEKEFAWFAISDSMPGLSISADRAARQILHGVSVGKSEVIITLPAKLGIFVHNNFPELFNFGMHLANRFLPQGVSQERKTGAASRSWLDRQAWARPFLWIRELAQREFNEVEKFDAEFNLNTSPRFPRTH